MPRKDPITGVPVMTLPEFWLSEAKKTGRPAHELQAEHDEKMKESIEEETKRYWNPEVTQELVMEFAGEDSELDFMQPTKVIEVTDVHYSTTFKKETIQLTFRAYCEDEVIRMFKFSCMTFAGDYYEPPDQDYSLEVIDA